MDSYFPSQLDLFVSPVWQREAQTYFSLCFFSAAAWRARSSSRRFCFSSSAYKNEFYRFQCISKDLDFFGYSMQLVGIYGYRLICVCACREKCTSLTPTHHHRSTFSFSSFPMTIHSVTAHMHSQTKRAVSRQASRWQQLAVRSSLQQSACRPTRQ